jgi:hypothetical protein
MEELGQRLVPAAVGLALFCLPVVPMFRREVEEK